MNKSGATQRIAEFVSSLSLDAIPVEVIARAKATLIYNLVTALASRGMSPVLGHLALAHSDSAGSTLLDGGHRVSTDWAIAANSALTAARTQEDTIVSALTHVGSLVMPSALALAESRRLSGDRLLVSLVAGYEVLGAVGVFAAETSSRGFRPAGLYGPIGVAAACSSLTNANVEETRSALALAAGFSGGTNQTWLAGTQEWLYQTAAAARSGYFAASLAEQGVKGAPDALEGPAGFYASFLGDAARAHSVGTELGERWSTLSVSYKPWPVCTFNQSPVSTLLAVLNEHALSAGDIERIEVRMNPAEAGYPGIDQLGPFTDSAGALMSVRFCMAVAAEEGIVRVADLERFRDPSLLGFMDRIDLVPDEGVAAQGTRLTVTTVAGQSYQSNAPVDVTVRTWTHDVVLDHVRALAPETVLGEAGVENLINTVDELEHVGTIALVKACAPRAL